MILPSWREGATRDALVRFLDAAGGVPPERRVAVFDNDGTLWCEKPNYPQLDFFVSELRNAAADRPELAERGEYRAVLAGDWKAISEFGLERVALALMELFVGLRPEEFEQRARQFIMGAIHPHHGVTYARMVYEPMVQLLELLREHSFATFVVSGGGTEFVRAVSRELYGIDPEGVVGTLVLYELVQREGAYALIRTGRPFGVANEGAEKIANIQSFLGRRPILAAGNSAGDTEMLDYAASADGASLGLLIDHDDAAREYAYESEAGTFATAEPITQTARNHGWTVVSMRDDWSRIFRSNSEPVG